MKIIYDKSTDVFIVEHEAGTAGPFLNMADMIKFCPDISNNININIVERY